MFEGFEDRTIDTGETTIHLRHGGSGPPLLLLHDHPRIHAMWHAIAPRLAEDFTVVAPDLQGYGRSSKPATTPDHEPYSKRAMARDCVELMRQLGFERFAVAGHDRGARCAYRLALDDPDRVSKLAVMDIIPTGEHLRRTDTRFALGYWHWFFLAQPAPLPENLIGANTDGYYVRSNRDRFAPEALADYLRAVHDPETIHPMCEDYRAGVTLDFDLDEADRGKRAIECPVLVLWSRQSELERWYDILAVWREWADDVRGKGIDCGHHLAEEKPDEVYEELRAFVAG